MTEDPITNLPARLNIGINAHLLSGQAGYRRAGIHQYIYQVLRHLPQDEDSPFRFTIYTQQSEGWDPRPDWRLATTRLPTENRLARIVWEQAIWPLQAWRDRLSLMHSMAFVLPRLAPCPAVVTIYDLSFLRYPEDYPATQRRYLANETARSCRLAQRIITISESGRGDVHHLFGVPMELIDVVKPGVSPDYRPLPDHEVTAFRARRNLPEQFLLHVGTLQPRKNLPVLLKALTLMERDDLPLVLVGGKGWFYETIFAEVQVLGLAGQVSFAGYVDDHELPLWYNAATALVLPSRYEGFGLPIVEALACGTPVIAADNSSLPEAGGAAALYFDPLSPDELAGQLVNLLGNESWRRRLRQEGPAQAARFSWARAGEETAAVYRRALRLEELVGGRRQG
ncbi:MAG: glycosyltransferase family 1 protein [Chloroflexota bacterium]